jgi:hypothetical protein
VYIRSCHLFPTSVAVHIILDEVQDPQCLAHASLSSNVLPPHTIFGPKALSEFLEDANLSPDAAFTNVVPIP